VRSLSSVGDEQQPLTWAQRRFLFVLGVPAFGLALAYTMVTTYVPVLLSELSGPVTTGLLLGAEGVLALIVPVLAGGWSDRSTSRLPVVLTGAGVAVAALLLIPAGAGSLIWISVFVGAFFVGYFVYYTPYYALYPDLVRPEARGRSQGFQGGLRSVGLLVALTGGGYLLSVWLALPFLIGAVAVGVATIALFPALRGARRPAGSSSGHGFGGAARMVRDDPAIRDWVIVNACLEAAIGALRTFVVLYLTAGLGFSLGGASGALVLVGVSAVLAAPVAGKLADRFGPRPVMLVAVSVFAVGLTLPVLSTDTAFVAAVVPGAFAAVVLMTLPYAILMTLMPETEHGVAAGLFGLSRGVGIIVGPLLAGLAIAALDTVRVLTFADTDGYSAIFAVAVVLLATSIAFLRRRR
jgi:MFS family permease